MVEVSKDGLLCLIAFVAGFAALLLTAAVAKPEAIDALVGATPSHTYGDTK